MKFSKNRPKKDPIFRIFSETPIHTLFVYGLIYLRFIENTPTSKHSCVGGGSVQDAFRKRKTSIKTPTHYMYNGYGIIKETQEPDKSCNLS